MTWTRLRQDINPGWIILISGGVLLLIGVCIWKFSEEVIATYIASLLPLSVAIIFNSLDKKDREKAEEIEKLEKAEAIKTLIAAELENVAVGMIGTEARVRSFVVSQQRGELNFSDNVPRPMPYTENLGSQITLLNQRQVSTLAILRANLTLLTKELSQTQQYGPSSANKLLDRVYSDMQTLAEALEKFASKSTILNKNGESVLLFEYLRDICAKKCSNIN